MTRWGIVSTVKADARDILNFAAYHLEHGAHRLYLYLDAPDPAVFDRLAAHPKIKVVACDDNWWAKRRGRPEKHQSRQFLNARHAYNRRVEVDWLAHIDVDEFLWPARPLAAQLADLPQDCLCARVRPIEALAPAPGSSGPETTFKAFHLAPAERQRAAERVFPTYGRHLSGGFLSHVAGKLVYRTGIDGLRAKIHNIEVDGRQNPGEQPLPETELCHMHAQSWEDWQSSYRYRMARGSYRPDLKPQVNRHSGGLSLHELFSRLESEAGVAGLRRFYDEICLATPALCDRLAAEGLLRRHDLNLDAARVRQFPGT
ncbi:MULTISPECIES: glycosyltransferase family 2 protein [Marinovum]|uniref:glycosyltransferase family 2 protein n=1 Tax=Marinovum TaxID=367771 RepID=UPI00237B7E42|nr:glycosyltransferase family 2 protein [Marinovum sp. SP66]MDD9738591.1 glycosyltransferase family 2 protein [Marinovum sp. SP66]